MDENPGESLGRESRARCDWARGPWLAPYHDLEWGVPVHSDGQHFELLLLEGAQAGLSWLTILKRRAEYRRAFADFEPAVVASFDAARMLELLGDPGIVRHRQKIEAAVGNAASFLAVQREFGSFDEYVWAFVEGRSVAHGWTASAEVPTTVAAAAALSADLRTRGFRFVGPTICYSYMQAAGLVNDHLRKCFRFHEVQGEPRDASGVRSDLPQGFPLAREVQ